MADVDHPKTHVEDQDVKTPRVQPESPKDEGIDPLTESDTMYPRENVKEASTFQDAGSSEDSEPKPKQKRRRFAVRRRRS